MTIKTSTEIQEVLGEATRDKARLVEEYLKDLAFFSSIFSPEQWPPFDCAQGDRGEEKFEELNIQVRVTPEVKKFVEEVMEANNVTVEDVFAAGFHGLEVPAYLHLGFEDPRQVELDFE